MKIELARFRTFRAALVLGCALALGHLALTLIYRNYLPVRVTLSDLLLLFADGLAVGSLILAARRSSGRENVAHLAWSVLAFGQACRTVGDLATAISEIGLHQQGLGPWGDGLFLFADSLFVLGLVLLTAVGRSSGERVKKLIDLGIAMIAAILVAWTFVIVPRAAVSPSDFMGLLTPLGYAIIDVLLIFALADLLFGWPLSRARASILLLAGGALAKVAAGGLGLVLCPPNGACVSGDWDASVWMASAVMIGLGGLLQARSTSTPAHEATEAPAEKDRRPNYEAYLSYLWVVAAYLLLITNYDRLPAAGFSILLWGTGAIVGLVILRQFLVLNENRQLYSAAREEVVERVRAEAEIRRLNEDLEQRVIARTAQLELTNRELQNEIAERRRAEQETSRLHEFNESMVQNMSEGIVLEDAEGYFTFVNPAAASQLGYTVQELLGKHWTAIIPPDQQSIVQEADRRRASGETDRYELQMVRKDGQRIAILAAGSPRFDATTGKFVGTLAVFIDLTERKRAEAALAQERNLLRTLIDTVPDYMYVKDTQSRFVVANLAIAQSLGIKSPDELYGKSDSDYHTPELAAQFLADEEGILSSGQPLFNREEYVVESAGNRRWLITTKVPLRDSQNRIVGVVGVGRDITERKRMEAELQASNEKLTVWVDQLEQSSREIALLSQLGDLLQSCRSADEAYQVIIRSGRLLFPAESGALYVLNNSRTLVEMVAAWGESRPCESSFVPDDCWGLRRGRLYVAEAPESDVMCAHLVKEPPAHFLCIPMMAQGETLGVLHLRIAACDVGRNGHPGRNGGEARPDAPDRYFTESKQQLAVTVAEHIALSLASLQLRETLRSQAIRDPLTGLFNRRYMEETIDRELHRAARNGAPLGMIMFDIDHFKEFNDNFGHGAGDAILRELGRYLELKTRREDIACRYGGDEFVLVLPECPIETIRNRAEQLRQEFKSLNVRFLRQSLPVVSLSLGVAVSNAHDTNAEVLLRQADQALYRAKAEGRDRIVVAS